jgi:hypothetical protein
LINKQLDHVSRSVRRRWQVRYRDM